MSVVSQEVANQTIDILFKEIAAEREKSRTLFLKYEESTKTVVNPDADRLYTEAINRRLQSMSRNLTPEQLVKFNKLTN